MHAIGVGKEKKIIMNILWQSINGIHFSIVREM